VATKKSNSGNKQSKSGNQNDGTVAIKNRIVATNSRIVATKQSSSGSKAVHAKMDASAKSKSESTLETTHGKINGLFSQVPFKCYLPEVASVGD
jgi:hypothetical protein